MNRGRDAKNPSKQQANGVELFHDLISGAAIGVINKVDATSPKWRTSSPVDVDLLVLHATWLLTTMGHSMIPGNDGLRRVIGLVQMILIRLPALSLGSGCCCPQWASSRRS
ncbi:MAG: hypothetical protein KGP12_02705 [Actinomycetales bacterium]|nr:hypothetical protein [Actinomycetales bacterium]